MTKGNGGWTPMQYAQGAGGVFDFRRRIESKVLAFLECRNGTRKRQMLAYEKCQIGIGF
jgi:hypothetical protein